MIGKEEDIKPRKIDSDLVKNASIKVLVGEQEGWSDYVMRVLEVTSYGYTPLHKHPWPHINYILEGEGTIQIGDKKHQIQKGSYAYIQENTLHQFCNTSENTLKFICIVPKEGHQN